MFDERKCVRCGMLQRMKDEEICEPCMDELILGQPSRNNAWNRFVEAFSDALISQERSERQ